MLFFLWFDMSERQNWEGNGHCMIQDFTLASSNHPPSPLWQTGRIHVILAFLPSFPSCFIHHSSWHHHLGPCASFFMPASDPSSTPPHPHPPTPFHLPTHLMPCPLCLPQQPTEWLVLPYGAPLPVRAYLATCFG